MRTFNRADWEAALQAWQDGQFSDEWRDVRHHAALRGMIYPPAGTQWDSWEDDNPSQRAILIRAIRETPRLLFDAIESSKSWNGVVAYVLARHDEWRQGLEQRERHLERVRDEYPNPAEAVMSIRAIVDRIAES